MLGETDAAPLPRDTLRARYMVPETKRLLRLLMGGKIADPFFRASPWRDLATYLLGFLDPRMRYYVFSFSDPRPLLRDLGQIVRKALRRDKS